MDGATMSININRALTIPGWMSEIELTWLAEQASKSTTIAEIGSWRGRSSRAMADNTKGTIFCVDTWADHAIGIPGWWTTTDLPTIHQWPSWLMREWIKNMEGCVNAIGKPMTSMQAAEEARLHGVQFDFIFVDASHDYQSVKDDILAWQPLLVDGGVFCGHDYNYPQCPDVKRAVDELIPDFYLIDTIWVAK